MQCTHSNKAPWLVWSYTV